MSLLVIRIVSSRSLVLLRSELICKGLLAQLLQLFLLLDAFVSVSQSCLQILLEPTTLLLQLLVCSLQGRHSMLMRICNCFLACMLLGKLVLESYDLICQVLLQGVSCSLLLLQHLLKGIFL